ncbi:NADPH-dependent F420 reductase [Actinacidiphila alni]|uniref:NADPH-dependent F420 reductase n=1 Tax=Actinacidiphila alni TaxID=380248 RepID=UPI003F50733F
MRIGILGTGVLARALAEGWARAGHEVVVGGRSAERADKLAEAVGRGVTAAGPRTAAAGRDAVLLAVDWDGAEEMLAAAGADEGALAGTVLIDPTNAVEHGVGVLLTGDGSMAARIAARAPGADVVKAFHLFPATEWTRGAERGDAAPVTVVICGDAPAALDTVGTLVRDVGARPAVLGGLDRARQLEEAAGFVIGLVFAGHDPNSAVPHVPSR